ncbi:tetratricopeptide repeat protein [Shewanella sp. PP-He15 brown]|jgi:tetratricopeptide (TPR) repeat protein|uniref:Tetratricopeptide repeat protein n=1 Tax=Shewanella septentrionalis TaxID=2952223 RepID=A0A9X2WW46_9GAMM|nr:tetratricopeptide repeat protein [Shewanella septentrionalis]MCT7946508.1 tetratricopeptide repeat protein [Shewanella septentrionalis]
MKLIVLISLCILLTACAAAPNKPQTDVSFTDRLKVAEQAYTEARFTDAETLYLQLTQTNPEYKESWFKLGNIYARQGRYEASIRCYEKVLALDSQDGKAWFNLAVVKLNQSRQILQQAEQILAPDTLELKQIKLLTQSLNQVSKGN